MGDDEFDGLNPKTQRILNGLGTAAAVGALVTIPLVSAMAGANDAETEHAQVARQQQAEQDSARQKHQAYLNELAKQVTINYFEKTGVPAEKTKAIIDAYLQNDGNNKSAIDEPYDNSSEKQQERLIIAKYRSNSADITSGRVVVASAGR